MYVVQYKDSAEPDCVASAEARKWSQLVFDYFIDRLDWKGINTDGISTVRILDDDYISDEYPEIICMY